MANSKGCSFLTPRILTRGGFALLAFLAVLFACSYSLADVVYSDTDPENPIPDTDIVTGGDVGNVTFNIANSAEYTHKLSGNGSVAKTGDGTFSLTGANTYTGATTISAGTLKIVHNSTTADKHFDTSTALAGAGTLEVVGNTTKWLFFSINADASEKQNFSGLVKATGYVVLNKGTNLGNATLQVGDVVYDNNGDVVYNANNEPQYKKTFVTFHGANTKNLTVKELNTLPNSTVRVSHSTTSVISVLTVGSGTVEGNLGDAIPANNNTYYNLIDLVKVSDGSEDGGTLTIKGTYSYTGTTKIKAGVLHFDSDFTTSSALEGSGKLEFGCSDWVGFGINTTNTTDPQSFTGTVNVAESSKIMIKTITKTTNGNTDNVKNLNLGNATLHLDENAVVGLYVKSGAISKLTVKELKTETGSTIRLCNANPGDGKFGTLTVGSGMVNGNIGEASPGSAWYNNVSLVKASDGSEDGGMLTINEGNYYTGTTTIKAGTLKLAGNGTLGSGAVNFVKEEDSTNTGTLEFAHTSDQTIANNISGTGNVVRSGSGVVTLSGALTYTGTTTINDGTTLKIVNNTYSNKDFNTSTALAGEGTLDLETIGISGTKQSWIFFSTDNAQDFSGLVKLTGAVTFDKDTSLKNATLHVSANCLATLHTDSAKNLAVKVLNTDSGSTVRYSHDPESTENLPYATLTVGSGTVNGTLGEANPSTAHLYFNKIHLVKTSDESATGGTLTINGNYYYTGTTTINAGTLKFTNNFATSSGLAGSGTLKMSGNGNGNGIYFGITDSASQPFTGTIQINDSDIGGKYRIRIAVLDGNSYKAANIKLPYATMEINGNTTGKESELIFNNAASSLSIGTLNGNPYSRILNLDDKTTSNTYCNLTVNSGNFAGEIGRNESSSSSYKYVNYINFTKASNGSADGGTLTIKGNVYYTGTTTIEAGTIRIENNGAKDSYKYFTASTALTGSGTLELAGSGWIGFSINSTTQQEFTGTVKVKNKIVIRGASATKALNLGKGTLRLEEGATVGLFVNTNSSGTLTNISALTVKELNTDIGSTILLCTNNTTSLDEKSGSLTVASGTVNGDFGQANPDITWYNQVNLFKVSDESDDGGTLIINGNNYYTGSIDIQGGTLKLTGSATLSQGATTIAQGAQLDFGYEDDLENPIEITDDNPISGSGKIVKSGSGVLKIDNINYADTISAESFVVNAGELDFRGYFEGSIEINNDAVFSPGNSIGTLDVTGDVIVNSGTALFEFGEYTGADVNHDVLNIREDNTFTAGNRMISLAFNSEFPAETWAADEDKSFLLISGAGFEDGKDYSQWLGTNTDLFSLTGGSDGLYLTVGASPEPVAGVPEPSTWALMALGVVVLFLRRRVRN